MVKLIGQWIPDGDGRGIARDIKKIVFTFKTWQKIVTKFGQFKKMKCRDGFQLCKLYPLCFHFLSSFEKENIFLKISLAIPRTSPSGIHWQMNFTKQNWRFCIFSTTKKWQVKIGISILVIPDHMILPNTNHSWPNMD